jgi:hypothetical protein
LSNIRSAVRSEVSTEMKQKVFDCNTYTLRMLFAKAFRIRRRGSLPSMQRLLKEYRDAIADIFKCLSWLRLVEPCAKSDFGYTATLELFELLVIKTPQSVAVSQNEKWISLMSHEVFHKDWNQLSNHVCSVLMYLGLVEFNEWEGHLAVTRQFNGLHAKNKKRSEGESSFNEVGTRP